MSVSITGLNPVTGRQSQLVVPQAEAVSFGNGREAVVPRPGDLVVPLRDSSGLSVGAGILLVTRLLSLPKSVQEPHLDTFAKLASEYWGHEDPDLKNPESAKAFFRTLAGHEDPVKDVFAAVLLRPGERPSHVAIATTNNDDYGADLRGTNSSKVNDEKGLRDAIFGGNHIVAEPYRWTTGPEAGTIGARVSDLMVMVRAESALKMGRAGLHVCADDVRLAASYEERGAQRLGQLNVKNEDGQVAFTVDWLRYGQAAVSKLKQEIFGGGSGAMVVERTWASYGQRERPLSL